MDYAQRFFLNPDSVSKHLFCSICQDVFNEPQRAPCGHSFCKTCIITWLRQSKTCPEDRKPLVVKQLHYDFILANIIGDQMVGCPFRLRGCNFINKLEMLADHKKTCLYNPQNLPEFLRDEDPLASKSKITEISEDGRETLATPVKPSLKMRLFQDPNKRLLLCSVFDNKENESSSSTNVNTDTNNVWLNKTGGQQLSKRKRHVVLDDSL